MKAIYFDHYGGPEVLRYGDLPDPRPRAHEVLVDVHAAAVNPRDWLLREGRYFARHLVRGRPIIPGSDISGVVHSTGDDVTRFKPGDAVVGMQSALGNMGGYAERIAIHEDHLASKPSSVSHIGAAAIPTAGLTAWQSLHDIGSLGKGKGDRVAIIGATGGVGHYAIQLAREARAHVTAICGPTNTEFAQDLGAHRVIDYRSKDFRSTVTDCAIVLDAFGHESLAACSPMLAPGGTYVTTVPTLRNTADWARTSLARHARKEAARRSATVLVKPRSDQLAAILDLMEDGSIRSSIEYLYPLADAAEAHKRSRGLHTRGKIVLQVR
ncbi:NADP-dependent oxidoreductase [Hoyosella sp. G463]|uniref:NADP-dependent oxidoreductase n=1 Tax=Lolliginicoccus lacisalsi TaxID=2742202 RepID=A0A927PM95_9ACTN|nr:NADP-dependent oxidoreductase [Lolliginicoccus lacisalsi]MBD8506136.1 NADP-dependent oxidoreductase [Lolliginicoccus lacisalsi]